ncbi:2,3-diphosphoglycerate-dependent phosphoglycerate mutase [Candidatus Poriferisodalis sp.]|uniref:2,3-diphosphoglycerate-dependent phosphoglycerate mutase n=1 Tax=Candidatus Poriferisodalis sp. TaxID=3101277 RepID=UPI003B51DF9E
MASAPGEPVDQHASRRPGAPAHTLVLVRHGQSAWNLENRFTGWWDVGLTDEGQAEARAGGAALASAGIEPDVVHTSLLRRAIQTANTTLDVMGRGWLPVRRHWRLNERHYGALTGLNKSEMAARHGADQVHLWRRSYDVPPPSMPAGHEFDVAGDPRYAGLAAGDVPRTECLADVVKRLLPYWYDGIAPDLWAGHTVLVAAHGNSLRGLVKHLDGIGDAEIAELNIPTGVPLVYELGADLTVASECSVEDRYLR